MMITQYLSTLASIISRKDLTGIPQGTPDSVLPVALNIVFAVAGAVSVLVITIAGLRLVLSSGNPEAVSKLRNTIVYAALGLVVCIAGFSIVNFVLGKL